MATLPRWYEGSHNGLYRPSESPKFPNHQGLEPETNQMGTTAGKLQFQNCI